MKIIIPSLANNVTVFVPITFIFWGFVFTYIFHIFEESIFPEVFVEKVKRLYWPGYDWNKFFWFNAFLLILNIVAIIVYELHRGVWIIFPLSLATERFFNGFYHLFETLVSKKYSSGLLSSVITWVLACMIVRYSLLNGQIAINHFYISVIIGFIIFALMIFPLTTGLLRRLR